MGFFVFFCFFSPLKYHLRGEIVLYSDSERLELQLKMSFIQTESFSAVEWNALSLRCWYPNTSDSGAWTVRAWHRLDLSRPFSPPSPLLFITPWTLKRDSKFDLRPKFFCSLDLSAILLCFVSRNKRLTTAKTSQPNIFPYQFFFRKKKKKFV